MIGRTYAFVTVVLVRSNSRTSGSSSDDSVTGIVGRPRPDDRRGPLLVGAVGVGVQERDRDRGDALRQQAVERPMDRRLVERAGGRRPDGRAARRPRAASGAVRAGGGRSNSRS